ncbi:hypothetical protein CCMA1212_010123 [Trichoderma ghanense]|uniref:Uncharacterized protein n=1 Tax=Trichoderma ghanense TaxID=65468 RepID=A0ABY2GQD5_9HYPO
MEEVSQPKRHAPIQQGIILLFCQLFGDEKLLVHTRAGSAGQLTVSTLKLSIPFDCGPGLYASTTSRLVYWHSCHDLALPAAAAILCDDQHVSRPAQTRAIAIGRCSSSTPHDGSRRLDLDLTSDGTTSQVPSVWGRDARQAAHRRIDEAMPGSGAPARHVDIGRSGSVASPCATSPCAQDAPRRHASEGSVYVTRRRGI